MALDRRLITQLREADNITARRLTRKSLDWQLTDEQLAKLDEATKIELGFPHDFLTNDFVRQMVFGGTHASIDNHRA